tara:strand:- start:174 stop:422 length:249 start_codon:yes stop_codon:yes gene_type:complete
MGELIDLQEFRKAKEEKELQKLQQEVKDLIEALPPIKYVPVFIEEQFQYSFHDSLIWPTEIDGYGYQVNEIELDWDFDWEKN